VVFASGKNRAVPGAPLHTGFRLSASGGSVLLSKPDGVTVVSVIRNYPRQSANISYGIGLAGDSAALVVSGADGSALVPEAPVPGWEQADFPETGWRPVRTGVGFDATSGMNGEGPMALWRFNDATQPSVAGDATGQGRAGSVSRASYTADGDGVTGKPGDRAMSFGGSGVMTVPSAARMRIICPLGDAFKSSKLSISLRAMATKIPSTMIPRKVAITPALTIR
jgi:hypothetical protein